MTKFHVILLGVITALCIIAPLIIQEINFRKRDKKK